MQIVENQKVSLPGIYRIVCLVNNKFYIGSAVNIYRRLFSTSSTAHLINLRKGTHINKHLQNAWNKYKEVSFKFEILELCNKADLLSREQYYLDTLLFAKEYLEHKDNRFLQLGYNLQPIAGSPLGVRASKETKRKLSKSKMGLKNPMFGRTGDNHPRTIKVIQYTREGKFVKLWDSIVEAGKSLNLTHSSIRNAIAKPWQKGGSYYWRRFVSNEEMVEDIVVTENHAAEGFREIPVIAKDILTQEEIEFKNMHEAKTFISTHNSLFANYIKRCQNDSNYSYHGYSWRYKY